jgi:hypothetical protein
MRYNGSPREVAQKVPHNRLFRIESQCTTPNHEESSLWLAERKIDLVGRVSSELRHSDEADANRLDNAPFALLCFLYYRTLYLLNALATGAGQR